MRLSPTQEAAHLAPFQADVATARAKMDALTTNAVRWNLARADYAEACDTLAAARESLCGPGEADAYRARDAAQAGAAYYHA